MKDHKKTTHRRPDDSQTEDFVIFKSAFDEIKRTVCRNQPESGGILLGNRADYVIQKFIFDPKGSRSRGAYDPDVNFINAQIKKEWSENQLEFLGFLHSHPRGVERLSGDWGNNIGDIGYMRAILRAIPALPKFLVPILFSPADGGELQFFPYIAYRGAEEQYFAGTLTLIEDEEYQPEIIRELPEPFKLDTSRLKGSADAALMQKTHVVCVGTGGANGICESLVRSGLGHITLIDFDVVDATNLVTQGFYVSDIGKLKIEALKERLLNINPAIKVTTLPKDFLELNEQELEETIGYADLLLMMTDNFHAQAHGNIQSLKYQVPAVFAIMYERARCSEITFTVPGLTPACHRCAVSSRYHYYLDEHKENPVTSTGSTNFHTTYLNSAIGLIALAILHRDTTGLEFSGWFRDRWERNLIQLRTSPFYTSRLFDSLAPDSDINHCFDAVWQKITPEAPPEYGYNCPDCGGLGDLRDAFMYHQ